jgi:hypothetical protein
MIRPPTGPLDAAFITPRSVDEALHFARKLRARMAPTGALWIIYPNPQSPGETEFEGSVNELIADARRLYPAMAGTYALGAEFMASGFKAGTSFGTS